MESVYQIICGNSLVAYVRSCCLQDVKCKRGERCYPRKVECVKEPCYPIGVCVSGECVYKQLDSSNRRNEYAYCTAKLISQFIHNRPLESEDISASAPATTENAMHNLLYLIVSISSTVK